MLRRTSVVQQGSAVSRWLWAAACVGAAVACPMTYAQTVASPSSQSTAPPTFSIRGFEIKGDNPLSAAKTSQVLAPYLRADATIDTLQKATAALESALREAGYGLHKVALPAQEVGSTVALEVVKFTIGRVTVTGNQHFDDTNIRASLPELREGNSLNFKRLAVQTSMANDNPGKQISVALKESEEADKIDATLQVRDVRPWVASVNMTNAGNPSSGRDRFTVALGHNNVFNRDHQGVIAYTTSLQRPSDVRQWGLNYKIPFYGARATLGVSLTKSDVLGTFATFTSTGVGNTKGVNYTLALEPEGGRRSFLSFSLDDRLFGAAVVNGTAVGVDRRSRPVAVGYAVRNESDDAFWSYNLDLASNLRGGATNDLASYRTEYSNAVTGQGISSTSFRIVRAGYQYSTQIAKTWQLSLRSQLQWSNTPLIAGEQMGLGGVSSLRGVPDRAISGDAGLQGSLEVNSPELVKGLRFSGFVDAGRLANRDADGLRRVAHDDLSSMGVGLRYGHPAGVSISADYGRLLTGSKLPLATNSSAPQKGDDRVHLSISVRF